MPTIVTTSPLNRPAPAPTRSAATAPSSTLSVASQVHTNPTMPRAMTDGNERSMSPATMTIVSAIAMIAKYGVVCANER